MIGIVILTHGSLSSAFLEAAECVVGEQAQVEALSIESEEQMEEARAALLQAVNRVNTGKGVIVLTDMFGGLSSHLAMSILSMSHIEVIAGVNLPMLIRIFSKRSELSLGQCAKEAQDAGRKYINIATQLLEPQKKAI